MARSGEEEGESEREARVERTLSVPSIERPSSVHAARYKLQAGPLDTWYTRL